VAHGYSLELGLAVGVLPRNVQHIGAGLAGDDLEPPQLIAVGFSRLSVDPRPVRQNGRLFWLHRLYAVKSNMSLRRTATRRLFIFQKDSENLDGLESLLGRIRELQEDLWFGVYESEDKGLFCHKSLFRSVCINLEGQGATASSPSRRVSSLRN